MFFVLRIAGMLFLNATAATVALRLEGVPFVVVFVVIMGTRVFTTLLTYFAIATLLDFVLKRIKKYFDEATWDDKLFDFLHLRVITTRMTRTERLLQSRSRRWMSKQQGWVIFLLACVPFIPYIPTATTFAIKNLQIKRKLIILMTASFIRTAFMLVSIYLFPIPGLST